MMIPRILLTSLFVTVSLHAQTIFSDDFSSYTAGDPLSSPWGSVTPNPTDADAAMEVVLDTGNFFGEGTSNKVLHVLDESSSVLTRADMRGLTFQVATLSLDFYQVSGVTGTPWRISFGLDASSAGNVFQATLSNGSPGSYTLDAKHTLQIVVNTSASDVDYEGTTLTSMHYDLWIDGSLITDNGGTDTLPSGFGAGSDMTAFRFTTGSSGLSQEIYVDNVALNNGALIPEPSTLALVSVTGLAAILLCRFRRARRA